MLEGREKIFDQELLLFDGRRLWQVSSSHSLSSAFSVAQLDEELKQNLQATMQQKYQQPGEESVTQAVDKLQQEVCN